MLANCFRAFALKRFGDEEVRRVCREMQVPAEHVRELHRPASLGAELPEAAFTSVMSALGKAHKIATEQLVHEYGQFFLWYLADHAGFSKSINRVAGDFVAFTRCLMQFMLQLYTTAGNVNTRLPQVTVQDVTDTSFVLLLYSATVRTCAPLMAGMLQQIATHAFGLEVTMQPLPQPDLSTHCQAMMVTSTMPFTSTLQQPVPHAHAAVNVAHELPQQQPSQQQPSQQQQQAAGAVPPAVSHVMGLDPETFSELFPFHFVMNRQFQLLQAGSGLSRVVPELAAPGVQVDQILTILFPSLHWDIDRMDLLLQHAMTSRVIFRSRSNLDFKGGLYKARLMQRSPDGSLHQGDEVLLFLGSPMCLTFDEMERHHLYLADLPPHDMSADFILMSNHRHVRAIDLEHAAERLMQEQQWNTALKATLAETLAVQEAVAGRPVVNTNSAVDVTINLLDRLILREEVDVQQVLYARDALLKAGPNVWQPVDFDAMAIAADQEVNEALGELLGAMPAKADADSHFAHVKGAYEATSSTSIRFTGTSGHASAGSNIPSGSLATSALRPPLEKTTSADSPKLMHMVNISSTKLPRVMTGAETKRSFPKQRSVSHAMHTSKSYAALARIRRASALMAEAAARAKPADPGASTSTLPALRTPSKLQAHTVRPSIQTRSMELTQRRDLSMTGKQGAVGSRSIIRRLAAAPSFKAQGDKPSPRRSKDHGEPLIVTSDASVSNAVLGIPDLLRAQTAPQAPVTLPPEAASQGRRALQQHPAPSSFEPALQAMAEPPPAQSRFLRWHKSLSHQPSSLVDRTVSESASLSSQAKSTGSAFSSFMSKLKRKLKKQFSSASWSAELFRKRSSTDVSDDTVPPLKRHLTVQPRQASAPQHDLKGHPIKIVAAPSGGASGVGAEPSVHRGAMVRILFEPSDELTAALRGIDEWQYDTFQLDRASNGHALSCLAYHLMQRMQLIKQLNLSESRLVRFLTRIEQGYKSNPYHSSVHAADVLRTLHVVLTRGGVMDGVVAAAKSNMASTQPQALPPCVGVAASSAAAQPAGSPEQQQLQPAPMTAGQVNVLDVDALMSPITLLSCYLAAVIHDFEHGGVSNDFLIRSSDLLALLYNDMSPLEHHHVSAAFMLMRDEKYAFFPGASKRMQDVVRKNTIDLVLSTDMKQHFAMLGIFNSKLSHERREHELRPSMNKAGDVSMHGGSHHHGGSAVAHDISGNRSSASRRGPSASPVWDAETRMLVLKMALKCADLGHLASSLGVHKQWVSRLEEEMFRQGDQERALGQQVSPLMDRTKGGVTKSQVGFFAVVALPMFASFAQVFPGAEPLHANVLSNRNHWAAVEEAASSGDKESAT